MANAIVLVPTSFTSELTSYGYSYNPPGTYDLIVGKTYTVVWDETEYTVTAMDGSSLMPGAAFIGNIKPYYPEMDTGEPFLIGEIGGGLLIVCVNDTAPASHTVSIYTEADATEDPSFDIVLKDRDGTEVVYPATVVRLKTADGAVRKFVNEDSVDVPVEKTVEPDFSAGDMEITPDAGNVFSKVTVVQPEGLIPANIPKDMFIAGVGPGEFEGSGGGGSGWVAANGVFTPTATSHVVTHSMGVKPDLVVVYAVKMPTTNLKTFMIAGVSQALVNKGVTASNISKLAARSGSNETMTIGINITIDSGNSQLETYGLPREVTETTFKVGNSTTGMGSLQTSLTYNWFAIGGIV